MGSRPSRRARRWPRPSASATGSAALEQAYAGYDSVPTTARSERYEAAMERLAAKYADDKEAAIFYALALLEAVDHRDKTYAQADQGGRDPGGDRPSQPDHPGTGALHHPRLRLRAARAAGRAGRRQVRQGGAVGAARPAHALAHLLDPRALGRLDPLESGGGEGVARLRGPERSRDDVLAGAARAGLHGLRLSAAWPES